ncbi:double-strand break repair protein AddB [Pseudooceanicola sp.]|uniref:double-strand break repair protein AddB n=1 Tax=Pseudooceanicola sp. TaxID=1914328 RepID=UPI00261A3CF6|nr:double-strand break repair protein AddB [Pseudooceanicola sp.]MDF1854935.1 double-strand break repair protein AddB [Pseudooceanicola sp.]
MFKPLPYPRLFGMPPGADFPAALVAHLQAQYAGRPPQALARVRLIVNTRRMARRIRDLFDRGPALLLPRIELITDLGATLHDVDLGPAVSPLRRRLELAQLISALLEAEPDLAPRSALYDLADSLAAVLSEMQGEGVPPEALERLDVSDLSGHWARALKFLTIARGFEDDAGRGLDGEARQRQVIERLTAEWAEAPPADPVILAGSTGSRGTTFLFMQAVARLPRGAVVLPGFDATMPAPAWDTLNDPLTGEDHPQFRFARVLQALDMSADQVLPWPGATAPVPSRNRVISLALRPAPVTHQWLREGPKLTDIDAAMQAVTLIEAPSARAEALSIALRLRQAVEDGQTAALITPDRMLTRQVAATLDAWDIVPDDSAGQPPQLSPPGRLLRHVASLFARRLTTEALLTLLKHPLTHSGGDRGPHMLMTRALELELRRNGPPHPTAHDIQRFAEGRKEPIAGPWADWVCETVLGQFDPEAAPLPDRVTAHVDLANRIAAGHASTDAKELWADAAGRCAADVMAALAREAPYGGSLSALDYETLFNGVLADGELREPDRGHPGVLIWGTLEARVQGADLVILGGLNDGSWPELPPPDPWLNRDMRHRAGLLLPERRIGLSAHDFQQAIAASEVWLTRSVRSKDAETVPSRWISRLTNLLAGLEAGQAPLAGMRQRGASWLRLARAYEAAPRIDPAPRPAPCPPDAARPRQLSVTEIQRLVRDPYAIYARRILRLQPLDPLMAEPDARLRGTVLHRVLENFVANTLDDPAAQTRDRLLAICAEVLSEDVPWPEARLMWQARLARVTDGFLADEARRQDLARPTGFERKGRAEIAGLDFTLTAKADRIDLDAAGNARIYDYKTGKPPSAKEQELFDRQLLLSAAIAERGGFDGFGPLPVAAAVYIGLGAAAAGETPALLDQISAGQAWEDFVTLIQAYRRETQGFTSRRMMFKKDQVGDYDQLARFGEWDATTTPDRRPVR